MLFWFWTFLLLLFVVFISFLLGYPPIVLLLDIHTYLERRGGKLADGCSDDPDWHMMRKLVVFLTMGYDLR